MLPASTNGLLHHAKKNNIENWLKTIPEDTSPTESQDSGYHSPESLKMALSVSTVSTPAPSVVSMTPSNASRKSSPKSSPAQLLQDFPRFNPPIYADGLPTLPPQVLELRRRLSQEFGKSVIPVEVSSVIMETALVEASDIPMDAWTTNHGYSPKDLADLWNAMSQIRQNAIKCWDRNKDKVTWNELVVSKILRHGVKDDSLITVMNIQSQNIDSRVIPTPPDVARLPKRANYAFALNEDNQNVRNLLTRFERQRQDPRVKFGILTTPCTSNTPLISGIEVKPRSADDVEAFVQLSIFLASLLTKYQKLSGENPPPIPGLIVKGHEWKIYLAWYDDERIFVNGPLRNAQADTSTLHGIFTLLQLAREISVYGSNVYWPWMNEALNQY